jgi:two-component system KDP operon response regulator KdpE
MNAASIKVLVIDDEPPIRKLLRMGLSTQGYDIIEATNGWRWRSWPRGQR